MRIYQWLLCCVLCLGAAAAHGVPVLNWTAQTNQRGFANLTDRLQNAVLEASAPEQLAPTQALGAQVWEWPESRFQTAAQNPLRQLDAGQRWVARAQLVFPSDAISAAALSAREVAGLYLLWPLHRLDYLHLSYRVNQGPWHSMLVGDRVPMQDWVYKNPFPAFPLPQKPGTLDLVLEVMHAGLISDRVVLSSRAEYRYRHFSFGLLYGVIMGLSAAMAVCACGMALAFGRKRFAAVAVLSLCAGFSVAVTSGISGMYMFTASAQWNDVSKMSVLFLLAASLPWCLTIVLGYARRSHVLWWASNVWLLAVLCMALCSWLFELDHLRLGMLAVVWVGSIALTAVLAVFAVMDDDPRRHWILITSVMGVLSLLITILNYASYGLASYMLSSAAFTMLLAQLGMLFIMYLQYRQGRSVLVSSHADTQRDALTGLRNGSGFEHALARSSLRMADTNNPIAFFWIQLAPSDALRGHYGDEGYEHGLVRLASALAACMEQKDAMARPEDNAFCTAVAMEFSPELANALATKMLSRALALTPEGDALTRYMRIAVAWLPTHGTNLTELKTRCHDVLHATNPEKKIVTLSVHLG